MNYLLLTTVKPTAPLRDKQVMVVQKIFELKAIVKKAIIFAIKFLKIIYGKDIRS